MTTAPTVYVPKACAYLTRNDGTELLVFQGPDHDGVQIPKGTIESAETPRAAARREIAEESGLVVSGPLNHVTTDSWTRYTAPVEKVYIRHFFHAEVDEGRDAWTHVVTGTGDEVGQQFHYFWLRMPTAAPFALSLDDNLGLLSRPIPARD